jgi:E3 ubiquitin-protein ligase TRIP12
LEYIDFFSMTSQNKSLAIVANCCIHVVTRQDFNHIRPHLDSLANRLRSDDKKTIEYVCQIFSRLAENFHRDASILSDIASNSLLKCMQNMLIAQPSLLNGVTFVSIIHMLHSFSAFCPMLAVTLLKMNMAETLLTLLIGSHQNKKSPTETLANVTDLSIHHIELIPRSPQELHEIVSLIGELLPRLPHDEALFQVDHLYRRIGMGQRPFDHQISRTTLWHWHDDQGQLRAYSEHDSRTIEHAWQHHEEEVQLIIAGRPYLIDLQQLQQINEETNQARFIKRIVTSDPHA